MSRISGLDTKPELAVRKVLHKMGYRFRLHKKELPGKPDIVLSKYKKVIFVHGCYWHRHQNCKYAYTPKSNTDFWNKKFAKNIKRDEAVRLELENLGWFVHVIWECQTKDIKNLKIRLAKLFK
jgi:DNA mismatch endonuclease (patch repair protein)